MTSRTATYMWLKRHIATLPRHEGVFLGEAEVAREAGTSRTPVREAFMRLESEGLLELIPRRGALVPPLSDSEIVTVMEARGMVEAWAVARVAGREPSGLVRDLTELLDEQEAAVADPVRFIEVDRSFHLQLVQSAGNVVVARFYEGLLDRQQRMGIFAVSADAERSRRVVVEHRDIVRSVAEGNPQSADDHMSDHLAKTLDAMLGVPPGRSGHQVDSGAGRGERRA